MGCLPMTKANYAVLSLILLLASFLFVSEKPNVHAANYVPNSNL